MRQRAETHTQRYGALTAILRSTCFHWGVTLQGRYAAFAADWHNRPHELAKSDDVPL